MYCFRVNITDVSAELLDIFFLRVTDDGSFFAFLISAACTSFDQNRIFGCREGLIGFLVYVEITEMDSWNRIFSCGSRNSEVFDRLGAAHAGSSRIEIIGDLRVVGLESFGPVDCGRLEQFHVSRTADVQFDSYCIVGLHFGLRDRRRECKTTYTTAEACRFSPR